jgi:hypothetical protein
LTAAVLQSNYLPWKGYFDVIHDVDVFVFYDDVQYTKNDWRNRNRIQTANGAQWLTVPVGTDWHRRICDVELPSGDWAKRHWRRIQGAYRDAPYFATYADVFEEIYRDMPFRSLSDLNQHLVRLIAREMLGIRTVFGDSRSFPHEGGRLERLLAVVRQTGATRYVSGPAAKSYLLPERFAEHGIEVVWKDYAGYPEYPQLHPPFCHQVSVIDLLFNVGPQAPGYIWGWRTDR